MNDLARINNGITFDQMLQQAELFVKSGFFPAHVNTKEKAAVIMMKGRELGLPFTEALSKISVINGQPCTKVETLLGLAQAKGIIEDLKVKDLPNHCEVTLKRKGQTAYTCQFGDAEALALGLSGKDNYRKQKGTMYRWRALAMALRVICPDAIGGLYLEEEIANDVLIQPATEDHPAQVTEIIMHESPAAEPLQAKPSDPSENLKAEDIPADSIPNWTFPMGKYQGKTLSQVYQDVNDTGKPRGKEYLQWCKENLRDEKNREIITRFLEMIENENAL